MLLEKAIEILESYIKGPQEPNYFDQIEAIKLGIEALKRLKELRRHPIIATGGDLPSETQETDET